MENKIKNYGVILGDHINTYKSGKLGAVLPYWVTLESGNYEEDLPNGEVQFGILGDKMNCVTQSYSNVLETIFERNRKLGKIPQSTIDWLSKHGFFDANGKLNLNDRIPAALNGTTREGNYLWKVAEWARLNGIFPEPMLPSDENLSWDEYYDRTKITSEMIAIGLESLKYFDLPYESVSYDKMSLMYHMKQAPLQVVIPGHAIEDFYTTPTVVNYFDTYEPFKKKVENVLQAMKILMIPKDNTVYDPKWLLLDIKIGDTGKQVQKLLNALASVGWRLDSPQTQSFVYDLKVADLVKRFSFANVHTFMSWDYLWEKYYYKGSEVGPKHREVINKIMK